MKVQQVINCSFSSWYPKFQKASWKSIVIPLPEDFVKYLLSDGLVLPEGSFSEARTSETLNDESSDEEIDWSNDDSEAAQAPSFPELDKKIKDAIKILGGCVFPKLNWSSPKDATWISLNNSLKCKTPGDIYLLLKSSDFVTHDISQPFKKCDDERIIMEPDLIQYELILRKWVEINPSSEFRCFVKNNHVIGICQRDPNSFYPHICQFKEEIIQDIMSFYSEKISGKFPDSDYVFDVSRQCKDKVKLIDFNPYGSVTDSLLFDWNEFNENTISENNENPVFRCITSDSGVQPSSYRYYALPTDFVDLLSGEDPYKFRDFLQMKRQSPEDGSSSSSDEENEA